MAKYSFIKRNLKGRFIKGEWKPRNCKCQQCGVMFLIKPSRLKTGRGKFCSRKCRNLSGVDGKRLGGWNRGTSNKWCTGDKNFNWKGGVSKINQTTRRVFMGSIQYKNWRRGVFKRDDYTCQICGKKGGEMRGNHIRKYEEYPLLRTNIDNGITICKYCDFKLVLRKEKEWESYFFFNLKTRNVDNYNIFNSYF